jgi:hypothetical protein
MAGPALRNRSKEIDMSTAKRTTLHLSARYLIVEIAEQAANKP